MNFRMCTAKEDCIRACVGTLIDRDDVPHVFDTRPAEEAWAELRAWLESHKKALYIFAAEDHAEFMRVNNPDLPYILLAKNGRGEDHAVICRNGQVIHDPAWYKSAIVGHHSSGFYYIVIVGDFV